MVAVATVALGMSGMSMAFAGTAGAGQTITIPQNSSDSTADPSLIIGSGSNTAYALMTAESVLFNAAPGCDLTGAGKDSNYENCGTDAVAPGDSQVNGANPGENGYTQSDENPYNDYTVQAPAVGSGGGVNQLNNPDFPAGYARSSANPAGSNGTGAQNYEAYAVDAVSWTAFKSLKSPSGTVTEYAADYTPNLSYQEVTDVWQGAVTTGCSKTVYYKWNYKSGSSTVTKSASIAVTPSPTTNNWECLATKNTSLSSTTINVAATGTTSADITAAENAAKAQATAEKTAINKPIDCYVAQSGSGTAGTWAGDFGYSKTETTGDCLSTEGSGQSAANHINLFENQMSQIANSSDADQANAIYFMSYGKFTATCTSLTAGSATSPITGLCAGTKTTKGQYTTQIGDMSGSSGSPTGTTPQWPGEVGADHFNNIQGEGGGVYGDLEFPVLRNLYNVYNNSSAAHPASQATLNLVSEYGFMCKAGTAGDFDPLTGVSYRTEIENGIKAQGFYPLDISPTKPFQEGSVTFPAYESGTPANTPGYLTDANYLSVDATTTNESGTGDGSDGPTTFAAGNGIPSADTNTPTNPYGFCLSTNG
jgi:hypothetical protein